jgi:hypothetical protein
MVVVEDPLSDYVAVRFPNANSKTRTWFRYVPLVAGRWVQTVSATSLTQLDEIIRAARLELDADAIERLNEARA